MIRTKLPSRVPQPTAILTSDWHLRETAPVCRTDDFWEAQWNKVDYVSELQYEYDCPVFHAGDLFHHWKPSPYLLSQTLAHLPKKFYTVYGQHDLPQHNLSLSEKCGIYTLLSCGRLELAVGAHFGEEPKPHMAYNWPGPRTMLMMHRLTWTGKPPWPGCTELSAEDLLRKYPDYDLILTGDNHKSFVCGKGTCEDVGRLLVNPGSLTRQSADQLNHRPCVYLWYTEDNTVVPSYLPINKNAISREHIDKKERHDERIEAFISRLNTDWDVGLDFNQNLEKFRQENNIRQSVIDVIMRALEP